MKFTCSEIVYLCGRPKLFLFSLIPSHQSSSDVPSSYVYLHHHEQLNPNDADKVVKTYD